ncbi:MULTISPECIES: type 1 glutamine amidotransferase [unclassified Archaeoglobus]|jgi:GMP synthase-like glutamine amidotransferase|uniref:type 1 glutamine amidotransferase n=1 Tax=unclassified Archaeoglobus TaxID=2643606 RepID=UPI0025B8F607|nr:MULTISPECIES: gamma-glutamyl-gamma-aminobutyrate hydrolase family protein [unclassified Archaeoglobus]
MKVAAIKNHPAEGLGYFEEVFGNRGIDYYYVEAYREARVGEFDALVILGGPMGVYEAEKYQFLKWEMDLIRENYRNKPVLGVCLGAQLIAAALGEKVYPYIKEIGWRKVKKVSDRFQLPDEIEVFQWHGDTFDLPAGAELIYVGDEVKNQCFVAGKAIAMQFHVEMTLELIEKWISDPKAGLSEEERKKILEESREKIEDHNKLCEKFVDFFLKV